MADRVQAFTIWEAVDDPASILLSIALTSIGLAAMAGLSLPVRADMAEALPVSATDIAPSRRLQTATFAGGCFWGVQAVFQHIDGVTQAVSGYTGGSVADPSYRQSALAAPDTPKPSV